MHKSRPVLLLNAILAGAQFLIGAAAFSDVFGTNVAGLLIAVVGAVTIGVNVYVQSQVTPMGDVAAYVDSRGRTVAGPASPLTIDEKAVITGFTVDPRGVAAPDDAVVETDDDGPDIDPAA